MSIVDEIIQINVNDNTSAPVFTGFSDCGMLAFHRAFSSDFKEYSNLQAVNDDFGINDIVYKSARVFFGQTRVPSKLIIGKMPTANSVTLTVDSVVAGAYTVNIGDNTVSQTATSGQTVTSLATELTTLITALTNVSASNSGGVITITGTGVTTIKTTSPYMTLGYTKGSTSEVTTYLNGLVNFDAYFLFNIEELTFDMNNAISTWVENETKVYVTTSGLTSDNLNLAEGVNVDTEADSLPYVLGSQNSRTRTFVLGYTNGDVTFSSALLGLISTYNVGAYNGDFRKLSIPPTVITATQRTNMEAKNIGYYIDSGLGHITKNIKSISYSDTGSFLDVVQNKDWLSTTIKERLFILVRDSLSLPYSSEGLDIVKSEITNVLAEGEDEGIISPDFEHIVFVPSIDDISDTDKSSRRLSGVRVTTKLLGKINSIVVELNVFNIRGK